MDKEKLWSLRLGYSAAQADAIKRKGLKAFLKESFAPETVVSLPDFLAETPKSLLEKKIKNNNAKAAGEDVFAAYKKQQKQDLTDFKNWWIERIMQSNRPLREKMTVFWHNHFVASSQKVQLPYWLFEHNNILRQNAFGNFRELTKMMLKTNAVLFYLDATNNKKGSLNENLSRELLELFTIGIGNFSEDDIKNGAKSLAGLGVSEEGGKYRLKLQDDSVVSYFGKTGKFKADELVDIIFEQPESPYFLTRKILKWFVTDVPDEKMVRYYGDYFKKKDFEIQPLLFKIFTEEYKENISGTKIKDPLVYILQLFDNLNIDRPNPASIQTFIALQGMSFYTQYNVKGWAGGRDWLTVQTLTQRNTVAGWLCNGRLLNGNKVPDMQRPIPDWNHKDNNLAIIESLKRQLLAVDSPDLQDDFEIILKPDFSPDPEIAANNVLQLFQFMVQTPEFQLV
ncbi:hypothetical protein FNO01nite_25770 [Flavobacterium noncentrifugens]|uniref:Uncharacterized conserved protein, DUF1800 family n=1 Tax=Flavobacterium noncentrifugens TaxID=1128970 RepID=A0A1G8ZNZ2_9FLAO|nr:DUF1800 domain-containing protein [Flavobacterium noncentrifugens]GEP51905.1 hypothetical protein FNO01nite_25770 [Flavobacterium noncentrifugens]SDK16314.1 Uncharacterized conserved protein, DUF1800 family [Flavobacterium noncentrifugens]